MELVDLVRDLSKGHAVSDQLTCLVVRRGIDAQQRVDRPPVTGARLRSPR
jgi:hypothetical protein